MDQGLERGSGTTSLRSEDLRLLTGRGRFVDDIPLQGAVHGAVLRSLHAHARIRRVDVSRALAIPGVVAVFTAADLGEAGQPIPVLLPFAGLQDPATQRPLASEYACHVGEPIAFVVAENRYVAEDALEEIEVDYEPLPVAAGLGGALDPGAPLAHADRADNVAGRFRATLGEVDAVFASAHRVFHRRLQIHRGSAQPMETRGVAAVLGLDGVVTVWSSTQTVHRLRKVLADMLGRSEEEVRVVSPDVGGAFGMKGNVYPEEILVPFAACKLGRPVRWTEDRREHFLSSTQERDQVHEVTVAVDQEGRIQAFRDHLLHDTGAYVPYGLVVAVNTVYHLHGPYRIPAFDFAVTSIYTNKPANAPYRGAGRPQATFVIERMLDQVADELGLDPAEVRRRNLLPANAMPYDTGIRLPGRGPIIYDSGDYPECLDRALRAIGYAEFPARRTAARREGRLLGIGVACYNESSGSGPFEGARIRVDRRGKVFVYTPTGDTGQGHETVFAGIVAGELGLRPEDVEVVTGDTATLPYGTGSFGTRTAALAGSAVLVASREVRRQALEAAGVALGLDPDSLTLRGASVEAPDGRAIPLGRLAEMAQRQSGAVTPGLEATHYFRPKDNVWPAGACAVIAEVNAHTGMVAIERVAFVHDCGRVLDPEIVRGQVEGGVAQGIAGALLEELQYDEQAQLLTASFMDYLMPTAMEVGPITHDHVESHSPNNPLGAKGSGESGVIPVPAAVARAIEDALGGRMRISKLPVRPEEIWQALQREVTGE